MSRASSKLLTSLQVKPENRTQDDIDRINTYLSKVNDLIHCDTDELTICSKLVKCQTFRGNDILFKKGESIHSWYYIMKGSVLYGFEMFVATKSFGIREDKKRERTADCIVLEETTVLLFGYENCCHPRYPCSCIKRRTTDTPSNSETSTFTRKSRKSQPGSDTSSGYSGSDKISTGGGDAESSNSWQPSNDFNNNSIFRQSTGSNSQRTGTIESDVESDEDNDFSDCLSTEVSVHDTVKDILMKSPQHRTSHEIDAIMHIIHNIPIFSLWTQSLRRLACKLARVKMIDNGGTVIIERGQKLQYWAYCLQGTLEMRKSIITSPSSVSHRNQKTATSPLATSPSMTLSSSNLGDVLETLRYSDNFGADLRIPEDQISKFYMVTTSDDCWLMVIDVNEFKMAKSQEPETVSSVQENKQTVVVMENRTVPSEDETGKETLEGNVLVKATSQKLVEYLFEPHSSAEQYFLEDFFLTYNIHLESTQPIRNSILDQMARYPERREQCTKVLITWIVNHFPEIEWFQSDTVLKFIELVVLMLLREGEDVYAGRICHACSQNSTKRTITLFSRDCNNNANGSTNSSNSTINSRKRAIIGNGTRLSQRTNTDLVTIVKRDQYPIEFARLNQFKSDSKLIGLYYIVNSNSCQGENNNNNNNSSISQLRIADRILQINSTSEEYLTSKTANDIVENSQMCTFTVKYDPEGFYAPFLQNYFNQNSSNTLDSASSSTKSKKSTQQTQSTFQHKSNTRGTVTNQSTKIERSASIHNGLSRMYDDNDESADDGDVCDDDSGSVLSAGMCISTNSSYTQPGYSTLPLKPTLITMTTAPGSSHHHPRKSSTVSGNNQSALKKMMQRCKAANQNNNNNTDVTNNSNNSRKYGFSLVTSSVNNKCRSAHTSPNRSISSSRGGDTLSNGSSKKNSMAYSDNKSLNGVRCKSGELGSNISNNNSGSQQVVKLRKLRNRCDSQPDLRKLSSNNRSGSASTTNLNCPDTSQSSFLSPNCFSSESVIKITYKDTASSDDNSSSSSTTFRSTKTLYMLVRKETEAIEVIMKSVNDLNLQCSSSADFMLVEVTVDPGTMLKQKAIKNNQDNLPAMIKLNSRLYLKRRDFSGQLLDQNEIDEIEQEMNQQSPLMNIAISELAVQVFIESYSCFSAISPTEIIDFVTGKSRQENNSGISPSNNNTNCINKFREYMRLGEKYMYLVVTAICSEYSSTNRRCKILKRLIKLARLCKELGNVEVFFSLMNGLDRPEVSRLRQTWDKLPNKELNMYRQMQTLLDVSGNMRLLRSLHRSSPKPVISMAALVTKDLTTVHEVHPTRVSVDNDNDKPQSDSSNQQSVTLINFEKLRIMSRLIRTFKNSVFNCHDNTEIYHQDSCYLLPREEEVIQTEILRERITRIENKGKIQSINRRASMNINPKKMYEKELCRLRAKHFLQQYDKIEKDDAVLLSLSYKCEPKSDSSGGVSSGMTSSISRNNFLISSDKDSVSLRHSRTGSISSKESIRYSSGSEQHLMTMMMCNNNNNASANNSGNAGQLQYLEPSRRPMPPPPPPPYGSLSGGQPPIPPRRRASTTPVEPTTSVTRHQGGASYKLGHGDPGSSKLTISRSSHQSKSSLSKATHF